MSKAFVDTTVLTDALLKSTAIIRAAKSAISSYDESELPQYAIKEFKAGPLYNWVWFHNKIVATDSYVGALNALHRMSLTPKRYTTATALEALTASTESLSRRFTPGLLKKYDENYDALLRDETRLFLKNQIFKAWKQRRKLTTSVVSELKCYHEQSPYEERGMLVVKPTKCMNPCCLAKSMREDGSALELLKNAAADIGNEENKRRAKVLKDMQRKPKMEVTDQMCRKLGDAVFAFQAPMDSEILTTNEKDHRPLAAALGKRVTVPDYAK